MNPKKEGQQQPPGLFPALQEANPTTGLGGHPTACSITSQAGWEPLHFLSLYLLEKIKKCYQKSLCITDSADIAAVHSHVDFFLFL